MADVIPRKDNGENEYLDNSPLFQSLLFGNEIRYTDMLCYFIETIIKNNHLNQSTEKKLLEINREKRHTDIWIDKTYPKTYTTRKKTKDNHKESLIIEPYMLIENKLKSLPTNKQLEEYSKKFVQEYLIAYKQELKNRRKNEFRIGKPLNSEDFTKFETNSNQLKCLLLVPEKIEEGKKKKIYVKEVKDINNRECDVCITWEYVGYSTLGECIQNKIDELTINGYPKNLFTDFANIVISISNLISSISKIKVDDSVLKIFTPPEQFKKYKLSDLYSKYQASRCAKLLQERIKNSEMCRSDDFDSVEKHLIINHDFSNGAGLFEVVKRVKKDVTYILQYQAGVLKKALILKTASKANRYDEWFRADLSEFKFEIKNDVKTKNEERYKYYKMKGTDKTFYYSYCKIPKDITLKRLISIMAEHINDNVYLNNRR